MRTVKDKEVTGMFRVKWLDKVLSQDYYNLSWANNHCNVIRENNRRSRSRRVGIDTAA